MLQRRMPYLQRASQATVGGLKRPRPVRSEVSANRPCRYDPFDLTWVQLVKSVDVGVILVPYSGPLGQAQALRSLGGAVRMAWHNEQVVWERGISLSGLLDDIRQMDSLAEERGGRTPWGARLG